MFFSLLKYNMKMMFRYPTALFWIMAWPIILCTFFQLTLSGMLDGEDFEKIPLAVVEGKKADSHLYEAMDSSELFEYSRLEKEEAEKRLKEGDICCYIVNGETLSMTVVTQGMKQTIVKSFLDTYSQISMTYGKVADNPEVLQNIPTEIQDYISDKSHGGRLNAVVIFFYAAIAMSSLFSSFGAMGAVNHIQADQSEVGKRMSVAPVHKMKLFLGVMCARGLFSYFSMILLITYLRYVIHLDFGSQMGGVFITTLVASTLGLCLGAFVGATVRGGEKIKIAILQGISIFGGFLAGMMSVEVKYLVHDKIPFVETINPASLVTNALYGIYYYDSFDKAKTSLLLMGIYIVLLALGTYGILRRQRYASV